MINVVKPRGRVQPVKGDDISERLIDFAVRIIRLVHALPKTVAGRHVGGQLVRAGTSAGANYEEGRGAESRADFIHKVAVAWKEMKESHYWLRVVQRAQLVKPSLLDGLLQETGELCAILARSVMTARKGASKQAEKIGRNDEHATEQLREDMNLP